MHKIDRTIDRTAREEALDFDQRAKALPPPRVVDIMQDYYWPRVTFAARGTPGAFGDNRFFFYKRHLDHLRQFAGKRVLNAACGTGELSLYLAHCGLDVTAFDFSQGAVEYARALARVNGMDDRIVVDRKDIRDLDYEENSFDLVTGEAALHHLIKYERCLQNLYRVLKSGGVALFWENFTFDPFIRLLRPINWFLRGWVGEHSLGRAELRHAAAVFDRVDISDHAVFYTYSRFFSKPTPRNRRIAHALKRLDDAILPRLPFLKRFYSLAYMQMHKS
jgi:ubiquinone/menaquinone biosynthesis C-methylase UbiE